MDVVFGASDYDMRGGGENGWLIRVIFSRREGWVIGTVALGFWYGRTGMAIGLWCRSGTGGIMLAWVLGLAWGGRSEQT